MNVTIPLSCTDGSPVDIEYFTVVLPGCKASTSSSSSSYLEASAASESNNGCVNETGVFAGGLTYNYDYTNTSHLYDKIYMECDVQLGGSFKQTWFSTELDVCERNEEHESGSQDHREDQEVEDDEECREIKEYESLTFEFDGEGHQDWLFYSGIPYPVYLRFYHVNGNYTHQLGHCKGNIPKKTVSNVSINNFMVPIMFFSLSVTFLVVVPLVRTMVVRSLEEREKREHLLACDLKLDGRRRKRRKKVGASDRSVRTTKTDISRRSDRSRRTSSSRRTEKAKNKDRFRKTDSSQGSSRYKFHVESNVSNPVSIV